MRRTLPCILWLLHVAGAGGTAEPVFPPPPRLATTAAELAKLKASADFPATRDRAARAAEALLAKPVVVPRGWGNWSFYYACPDDGTRLKPLSLDEHQCPRCKKVYRDKRTVAAYRTVLHNRANAAALRLAWAYAYTGDDRFAAEVRRILLRCADDYRTYPLRRDRWGRTGLLAWLGGRRYSQSLTEAVGVIALAKAYDLTRGSAAWTDGQRRHVERDFFRATADTLLFGNQGVNNHQTWYNAGLMAIASVLGDAALVRRVLGMPGGVRFQLAYSVGRDGLWYEGTMAYHNYALQAMVEIADAARRMGLAVHAEPRFRAMIEAPLQCAYPNGQFPAINDSDPVHLRSFGRHFLWAWRVYGDPLFAHAWADGHAARLRSLLGPDAKLTPVVATRSANLPAAGLAILRCGAGADAVCAMLDYGPHGGGHGHFDKLNLVLFANGREWLLDPGRLNYSHKEYKTWVKHTVAHNTVTLGGRTQAPTTGRLLWMDAGEGASACAAESRGAYPGALLRRYLFLDDRMLVDVFEVEASASTQIDWLAHAISKRLEPVGDRGEGTPVVPGKANGYPHLAHARAWQVAGGSQWDFVASPTLRLRLWLGGCEGEQAIAATGIGYRVDARVPCLVRRVVGRRATFATVYDLSGAAAHVRGLTVSGSPPLVAVDTAKGIVKLRVLWER